MTEKDWKKMAPAGIKPMIDHLTLNLVYFWGNCG